MFNLTRNLGGAVGLALLNTLLTDRTDLHYRAAAGQSELGAPARHGDAAGHDGALPRFRLRAGQMALKQLAGLVHQQATVMAFADIFLMFTLMFACLFVLALIMKPPDQPAGAAAAQESH